MSAPEIADYLERPMTPADPATLAAIEAGPADPAETLGPEELDRLLDPSPLRVETGWCSRPGGVGYVAVRTEMPGVTGEMVDWWFDWHPRDPVRYRAWHPIAHSDNSLDPNPRTGAKRHWGAVHHPVEDVGTGTVHARIAFVAPSELGFSGDALEDPRVATIACARVGDDGRHLEHSLMAHVFLAEEDGVVLRSHFWLGAAIRPYAPGALAASVGLLLNNRVVRRLAMPSSLAPALARHCAEEYANLAAILPELHAAFG